MSFVSPEFLSALFAIVVIDLVLAGDNAIVIALAARNLPAHLRKRAVIWGTVGAIGVRAVLTLVVVWLLQVPGLQAIGGALLVWIAYRLLVDSSSKDSHGVSAATGFWGAMKTIIVADALMGLDNVLAVAGAAQGSFVLVVLGLVISVPIVIWGSQLILKLVERYPAVVYLGAGVLAWTAVKMVVSEPLLEEFVATMPVGAWLGYVLVTGAVLAAGFISNHRAIVERFVARLREPSPPPAGILTGAGSMIGVNAMKILLPVDDSPNSLHAVRHVVNQSLGNPGMEVHLLHVRTPLSRHIASFVAGRDRARFHRDEAEKALKPARELLNRHGVRFSERIVRGAKAEAITHVAGLIGAQQIVMGTARKNSLTRLVEASTVNRVIELATAPVQIVAGGTVSKLERFGIPAGLAAGLALVATAID